MNLAAASGEDLATTSDIVTDALTAFGLQAGGSGHFANIMAVAASNANTNVGMMGETFKYVAPVAGALGYSVDDTALAIGLMANSGIKATQAGTALRSIFTRLSTDAGASSKSLGALGTLTEKLGVEFYNTDGSARDLNAVLMDSRAAWAGLSEEQQITYAKTIAGQEAMSGWLALMNAAPGDVDKLTAALNDCNGAAEKMASTMVDNLKGDLTLLGSAFESLQIAISDSLTPTLREFAQFGQKAMANLLDGFQSNDRFAFYNTLSDVISEGITMLSEKAHDFVWVSTNIIMAIANGILDGKNQIIASAAETVNFIFSVFDEWLYNSEPDLIAFGKDIVNLIFDGFSQAGEVISNHIGTFIPLIAEVFATYHETLFTVGIDILGAIGQGIIDSKNEIQSIASETITNMVTSLRDNAPMIIEGGIALLEALVGAIEENLPYILEAGAAIIGELISGISTASPGVQAIIATAVLPHILKIVDTVGKIGEAVSSVASAVGGAINIVIGIGGKLMGGISKLFGLIAANPVVAIITGIIATVVLLYTKCEWFRDAVHAVIDAVVGFFQGAWEAIQAAWSAAVDFFLGIVDGIKAVFDGIGDFLGGLFTAAWEMVQGAWEAAKEFFGDLWSNIKEKASDAASNIRGKLKEAWDNIKSAWGNAKTFFGDLWSSIKEKGGEAAGKVKDAFGKAWDGIKSVWDGTKGFFEEKWSGIREVFGNAWDKFKEIGGNIVGGIKDGILGAWDSFISWIGDKAGGIVTAVKNMLGIHSPSTVFAGIGENMALGLGEGWDDEYQGIKRQIESGLNFGTSTLDLNANARYGAQEAAGWPGIGWGNTYVTINSPEAVDGAEAARVWKKETQKMAIAYV